MTTKDGDAAPALNAFPLLWRRGSFRQTAGILKNVYGCLVNSTHEAMRASGECFR
jgi:hypothetical protein